MKNRLIQRKCKTCGKRFHAERRTTCSDECQAAFAKANGDKQRQSHKQVMIDKIKLLSELSASKPRTIYEALLLQGHDEDFNPEPCAAFLPTDAPAGSPEKVAILTRRVELGQPLWHDEDRQDYAGMTGAIDPVDRTPRRVSERNVTRMLYSVGRKGLAE